MVSESFCNLIVSLETIKMTSLSWKRLFCVTLIDLSKFCIDSVQKLFKRKVIFKNIFIT